MYFRLDETQLYKSDSNSWMGKFAEGELPLIINSTWALIIIITQILLLISVTNIHQQRHEKINGGLRRLRWRMSVWIWVVDGSVGTDVELKNAAAWLSHIGSWGLSLVSGFFSTSTSGGCLITQCEKADVALCSKRINTGRGFWHMLIWLSRKLNANLHHFLCISTDFWEAKGDFALSAHKQKMPLPDMIS